MGYKAAFLWFTVSFIASCTSKKTVEHSTQAWREMDALAITMENAFRPLRDSSSVEAAAKLMAQIAVESEKLATSRLPDKMNNDSIRKKLEKLKTDARALANEIASGTEEDVIGTDFYNIHDSFREIYNAWTTKSLP